MKYDDVQYPGTFAQWPSPIMTLAPDCTKVRTAAEAVEMPGVPWVRHEGFNTSDDFWLDAAQTLCEV